MGSTGAAVIIIGAVLLFCSLHVDAKVRFNDVDNCGKCKHKCPRAPPHSERTCKRGKCGTKCKSGWKDCDRKKANGCEVDMKTDVKNCGSCGNVCPTVRTPDGNAVATCTNGVCGSALICPTGLADCDGDLSNGCEIDLVGFAATAINCGSCGNICPLSTNKTAFSYCNSGVCTFLCNFFDGFLGVEDCDGDMSNFCEVNTRNDVNNCGGCGNICVAPPGGGQIGCIEGTCTSR
ncbi:hypothetical protein M758_5G024900 [Ceratodon purpureus]|nr:hypothetical protein M758_5G024900 [Ceratodon purpureus]